MENQRNTAYPGFRYSKDNVSILVTIDARRPKKTGLFPVRVQIVYKRVQRFYPTGKELSMDDWNELLRYVDVLVDGRYIDAERDIELEYRGSRNQRLIDVKRSEPGTTVEWVGE